MPRGLESRRYSKIKVLDFGDDKIERLILTQEDHATSAPRAVRVSMRTAVWMVLRLSIKSQ